MKLQLSDGNNIKKCEVIEQDNGNITVLIDDKTFEFDIPEINSQPVLYAFTEEGPFLLSPEELELLVYYRGETIHLQGNPYHDKYGKFTSVGSAVRKTGVATQVVGLASIVAGLGTMTATRAAVNIKTKQIQKSEGIGKSEARDKVLSQYIISRKIGNKNVEFTYEQVDRFGIKLAKMGRNA